MPNIIVQQKLCLRSGWSHHVNVLCGDPASGLRVEMDDGQYKEERGSSNVWVRGLKDDGQMRLEGEGWSWVTGR